MNKLIACLRPGDGELWGCLARRGRPGRLEAVEFDSLSTDAFSTAYVADVNKAVKAVSELVGKLNDKASGKVTGLWCATASDSVELLRSRGSVLLSRYGRIVMPKDIEKCVDIASTLRLSLDRAVLHQTVSGYSLDGADEVRDPLGMEAVKLESTVNTVTMNRSTLENLRKSIEESGYYLDGFIYTIFADHCVLAPQKLNTESMLIADISADVSHLACFDRGRIAGVDALKTGTRHILGHGSGFSEARADEVIEAVCALCEEHLPGKIVIEGELATSEEFSARLERASGITPMAAVFQPREGLQRSHSKFAHQKLSGMLKYLELNELAKEDKRGVLYSLVARSRDFISKYF